MGVKILILCMVVCAASAASVPQQENKEQSQTQMEPRTFNIETDSPLLDGGRDSIQVSVARVITKTLLFLGAAQVIYVLTDDYILQPLDIDLGIRRKKRDSSEGWIFEQEILRNIIDSVDLVNLSFNYMEINSEACRQKAVCRASARVSSYPWLAGLIGSASSYISPYVSGFEKYMDAVDVGETHGLKDCSLLFAECQEY